MTESPARADVLTSAERDRLRRGADWTRPSVTLGCLAVGVAGAIAWILAAAFGDAGQAYYSYLTAFVFAIGIAWSALILIVIGHLIGAEWFVVVRRTTENVAGVFPALAVLFLPVAIGVRWLYSWTDLASMTAHDRALVAAKTAYLNLPFFYVRAAVYFACWIALAALFRRWSFRQDEEPGERWQAPQNTLSGPGAIVVAFTLTFAAFDWIMSLAPTWVSTIFGVEIFAGGMVGALGLVAVLMARESRGALEGLVQPDHFSAIGKMLLTFVIFWAYASFAQLLIIWIANVPEEVTWYVPRLSGSWLWTGVAVAIGQFAFPFFSLLSYRRKRRPGALLRIGAWILLIHYIEVYWIVMPQFRPESAAPHWEDAAAAAMVLGLTGAWTSWRARAHLPLAIGDPSLRSGLAYSEL